MDFFNDFGDCFGSNFGETFTNPNCMCMTPMDCTCSDILSVPGNFLDDDLDLDLEKLCVGEEEEDEYKVEMQSFAYDEKFQPTPEKSELVEVPGQGQPYLERKQESITINLPNNCGKVEKHMETVTMQLPVPVQKKLIGQLPPGMIPMNATIGVTGMKNFPPVLESLKRKNLKRKREQKKKTGQQTDLSWAPVYVEGMRLKRQKTKADNTAIKIYEENFKPYHYLVDKNTREGLTKEEKKRKKKLSKAAGRWKDKHEVLFNLGVAREENGELKKRNSYLEEILLNSGIQF